MFRKSVVMVALVFVASAVVVFVAQQVTAGGRGGPRGFGRFGRPGERGGRSSMFDVTTLPGTQKHEQILQVLRALKENPPGFMANVPESDGRLLRVLTETINAQHVVEIGTSNGYSGLWFAMALVNTGGRLTTFEISHERVKMARENFKKAGVGNLVTVIEGNAHEKVQQVEGPIDLLFLDADKRGYIDYLNKLLPKVRPGGLVVAHNMNERMADPDYVKVITENRDLETIFVHAPGGGVGVTMKKRSLASQTGK